MNYKPCSLVQGQGHFSNEAIWLSSLYISTKIGKKPIGKILRNLALILKGNRLI